MPIDRAKLLNALIATGFSSVLAYFLMKMLLRSLDQTYESKKAASKRAKKVLARLNRPDVELTDYESLLMTDVVDASAIKTTFSRVGGLSHVIDMLMEEVVVPFGRPDIFSSPLLRPPRGILMFGPPGCGKTLLARALAKECGCVFINLKPETFMDKWYGESQKLIAALFSLARKLQPAVIFIDEIDSFLRSRTHADSESAAMVKAQFMAQWDGFEGSDARVVIVAATNRPADIDPAVRRRLTRTCHITLPDKDQRREILRVILDHECENVSLSPELTLNMLASVTHGYSGSDLFELCRLAAMKALKRQMRIKPRETDGESPTQISISVDDVRDAREAVEHSLTGGR